MRVKHVLISLAFGALGFLVGIFLSPFFKSDLRDSIPYLISFVFFYITLNHFIRDRPWGESKLDLKIMKLRGR